VRPMQILSCIRFYFLREAIDSVNDAVVGLSNIGCNKSSFLNPLKLY